MTRLDPATMKHLSRWCAHQFVDNHIRIFNGMVAMLESVPEDERRCYEKHSWWHAYDVAKALGYLH